MDTLNNLFNNFFIRYFGNYFYDRNKLKPVQPANKYIENYKNSCKFKKFKKFPLVYTNPRWDPIKKKLMFNSFDQELEMAKKKPCYSNEYYWNNYKYQYSSYNKNISYYSNDKFIFVQNPRWNKEKQKLEWNFIYKK